MFMGGSNTSLFGGDGRKSIFRSVGQGAHDVGGVVSDAATWVGSSVRRVADAAAETVSHVTGGIRSVADRGSRTAGQAADAIASAYDATTNVATSAADTISNAATSAAHAVQETGSKWGNTVQQNVPELFERQPLLLGAVGLAIGAGIAASIPTTEAENKVPPPENLWAIESLADSTLVWLLYLLLRLWACGQRSCVVHMSIA
jgi:hypothetical protein